ncbi:DUF4173 domain-containing protein [Flavobacterium sp. I-SCBP12n]|uniref:DUF4173 domain-containing protein n=1 Tax=Flavobacterium pygoscelis TaxID=2893176 RepID=A0A9X1XRS0_9FLAO|nr:DUF4173 domain-containing protein [Flavobacterium pygoscelis]MCK8141783.1 DUF4173 domain-containing protein [Flavobacterium pygoscelis]
MKKHTLIFSSTLLFFSLFYKEGLGINLAFFALFLIALINYNAKNKTFTFKILSLTSVVATVAYAWFGDAASFFALFFSILFLQFENQEIKLKTILSIPIIFINFFSSLVRPFLFKEWLPETKIGSNTLKKAIAYVLIPLVFMVVFFTVYTYASNVFSGFLRYEIDFDFTAVFFTTLLGFYISFSFWNYWVPNYNYSLNSKLQNLFPSESQSEITPSFSFLDLDFERKSGEISLILLNVMLLFFITAYNYEQFFQIQETSSLSSATHDGVNSVMLSIFMAIGVLLFYFKKSFNFDDKANFLKVLAKIWIFLNAVLVFSSAIKNYEYVCHFGLTYKRLGVFAFLAIILIGLVYLYLKIKNHKTNAYLFNVMLWYLYGLLMLCACVNWGNLITIYNINSKRGIEPVFLSELNFNDKVRRSYFEENKLSGEYMEELVERRIEINQNKSFLSKNLYYQNLENQK